MSCLSPQALVQNFLRADLSCEMELMLPVTFLPPEAASYLATFALTLAIEAPFYFLAGKLSRAPWKRVALALLLCNLATHPAIHFLILPYAVNAQWRLLHFVLISESFAAFTEIILSIWILQARWWQAILVIGLANLTSWSFS